MKTSSRHTLLTSIETSALRVAITIMENWRATGSQIESIRRVSQSSYNRAKGNRPIRLDRDQMTRISLVLNIYAALRTLFDSPIDVTGAPAMKNDNEFFGGRPPLEVLAQGGQTPLYETYRRIHALLSV